MTNTQITASAQSLIQIANSLKSAYVRAKEFSDYNSVTDPGWSTLVNTTPSVIDSNGCILGTNVSPVDVSNAIGSINQFINYWGGQSVPVSAWGQNIQKVSSPIV